MLRDGPTQTGIGYPKFFVWVRVLEGDTVLEEGAVVLAAMDKKEFSVMDYHEAGSLRNSPQTVRDNFPSPIAETILSRMK